MGIKGIYGEIGPGERIALSKLAVEKFEETGRPLRIAIDISIWQFQIQAGQGGSNPAIRTFYYRLLRLLSVSVQPLFVFDGPHKPPFKRNKRSGHHGASVPNLLCKQLLNLFGFPFHMAPGEAEAECALLQREGIVDAVLSEDVDTLMFGSGLTLRNWSFEGRGNKSPTHVSVYHSKATKEGKSGLDREGMILVALMSGGDYITEGLPHCGTKTACEAARAGFGKSLCSIPRTDKAGLDGWRKNLAHEIQTNEGKFFRCKHKTLQIPDNFPNREVLGYYTHPVVSSAVKIDRLKDEIVWDGGIDIPGLRVFVGEAFEWTHKVGAKKFIRGLAPVLLIHKLRLRGDRRASGYDDVVYTAMQEMELVRAICGRRTHFSTDATPELRVIYHPADIVGLDLDAEEDESEDYGRDGLAPRLDDDDDIEGYISDAEPQSTSASPGKRAPSQYDPTQPDKLWILETIAKVGIPLKVEDFEESLRNPKKFLKAKATAKKAAAKKGMPDGAMDKFVTVSKPRIAESSGNISRPQRKTKGRSDPIDLPPVYLAPALQGAMLPPPTASNSDTGQPRRLVRSAPIKTTLSENTLLKATRATGMTVKRMTKKKMVDKPRSNANPWTLALSSSPTQGASITKHLGQQKQNDTSVYGAVQMSTCDHAPISSPQSSPPTQYESNTRKHTQSPQLDGQSEPEELDLANFTMTRSVESIDHHLRSPSSNEKDRDRPSPRKKRSPLTSSPTSSPDLPSNYETRDLGPEPVNRKIDFGSSISSDRSSSPHFPTLQELFPQNQPKVVASTTRVISLSSSPEAAKPQKRNVTSEPEVDMKAIQKATKSSEKKYILLRDSLPGGWKQADLSELVPGKSRAWRLSQVEVLDMTDDRLDTRR